ncbi:MAG: NHL repeat-containing protein, partial [Acidimicrobiia bacterium]
MTANGTAATAAGDPTLAAGPSPTGRRPVDAPATIGAWGNKGRGFAHPVDVAADPSSGTLCVLNRSTSWASPHGGAVRVTVVDPGRHEVLGEISRRGTGPGELMMPVGVAVDGRGRVLVTDEHTHTVSAFDLDGAFRARWGEEGGGPGQLRRPAGIAVDGDDVWVVDAGNSRLQRFGDDGRFRGHAGGPGCGPGQLHQPWFVAVGPDGDLFLRPAGIAVTPAGWLHVADWGRDRLMVFDPDLRLEA